MEFDVVNAIYAASVVFIFFYIYKVPLSYYLILLAHLALVFLTNDFLFPISYMPDQNRYIGSASQIRETLDFLHYYQFDRKADPSPLTNSSLFFAVFPIPFIKTVFSIAIINFMLYAFLFIFLYRKKILVGPAIWFYLLFPSLALYAALGLRDILILVFMVLSIYYLYKRRILLSFFLSVPLLFIKAQNFLIFILALLVYKAMEGKSLWNVKTFLKVSVIGGLLGAMVVIFSGIEIINKNRRSMFAEDGGDLLNYIPITGFGDLLVQGFTGFFYMILKPLPWEAGSMVQLVQSAENIVVFYIIYKLFKHQKKVQDKFVNFLIVYFVIAMAIYGIVVFNFGTAARYKFTFETIFIVFSMSIFYKNSGYKKIW